MNEGAAILTADGIIVYSNRSFASMLDTPLDEVIGTAMDRFVFGDDLARYQTLIQHDHRTTGRGEIRLVERGGQIVPGVPVDQRLRVGHARHRVRRRDQPHRAQGASGTGDR